MFSRFAPQAHALLRIVSGLLFAMHGSQKLLGWPASQQGGGAGSLPPLMLAAGIIELVAGLMIAIGLFTAIAAFLSSGEMAAAFFIAHAPQGLNPALNGGELAVLYCFVFLYIATHGGGIWSVDAARGRRGARA